MKKKLICTENSVDLTHNSVEWNVLELERLHLN